MQWWQQLIISIVTISFGALLGFCLSRIGARREKIAIDEEKLRDTLAGILVELEVNLELARQPFNNKLVPFVKTMWEVNKAGIARLPKALKDVLYNVYVEIEMANHLVDANIHQLDYGLGYYNDPYKEKKDKIVETATLAIQEINNWQNK